MRTLIALLTWVSLTAVSAELSAASAEARRADFEARYVRTGDIEQCLSLAHIDEIRVLDHQHIVFRVGLNRHYLNTLPRPCQALRFHHAIAIETRTARLCDVDWVRVLRPFDSQLAGVRGPACGLGRFERLEAR